MTGAHFAVTVDVEFAEHGIWVIEARPDWRNVLPPERSDLVGHGRLALLAAIAREGARGRSLGATRVRVHMSGHSTEAATLGEPERGDRG